MEANSSSPVSHTETYITVSFCLCVCIIKMYILRNYVLRLDSGMRSLERSSMYRLPCDLQTYLTKPRITNLAYDILKSSIQFVFLGLL